MHYVAITNLVNTTSIRYFPAFFFLYLGSKFFRCSNILSLIQFYAKIKAKFKKINGLNKDQVDMLKLRNRHFYCIYKSKWLKLNDILNDISWPDNEYFLKLNYLKLILVTILSSSHFLIKSYLNKIKQFGFLITYIL